MASSTSNSGDEEECHQQYALQLATASVLPMALKAAIELRVLEIIHMAGPGALISPSQIASQMEANGPADLLKLDLVLGLLASHSILTCSVPCNVQDGQLCRLYGLAPVARYFIKNQDGGSLSPFLMMIQHKVIMDMWYHLKDAVIERGSPFQKAHGINAIQYVEKDESFSQIFKASMRDFNPLIMQVILDKYDGFEGLTSVVDVGGGDASVLNMILSRYPSIKAINYDLPAVVDKSEFPSHPARNDYNHIFLPQGKEQKYNTFGNFSMQKELKRSLSITPCNAGIEHVKGDMFLSVPKGEAILMKWILHAWDDGDCLKLLRNCYEALPAKGKVIAVDMVVPEAPDASASTRSLLQSYFYMASMNPRGKERTKAEFNSLAKQAGFSHAQVACRAYNFSVVEFLKQSEV